MAEAIDMFGLVHCLWYAFSLERAMAEPVPSVVSMLLTVL